MTKIINPKKIDVAVYKNLISKIETFDEKLSEIKQISGMMVGQWTVAKETETLNDPKGEDEANRLKVDLELLKEDFKELLSYGKLALRDMNKAMKK